MISDVLVAAQSSPHVLWHRIGVMRNRNRLCEPPFAEGSGRRNKFAYSQVIQNIFG